MNSTAFAERFRDFHFSDQPLLLPNAWDAASAKLLESCGAVAVATTSAGLAWSHGYPDGNAIPTHVLVSAVAEMTRVISVPLTVDLEGGYSNEPLAVGEAVAAVLDAGAVGVNLEDGSESPDLLAAKIRAAKKAADRAGLAAFTAVQISRGRIGLHRRMLTF